VLVQKLLYVKYLENVIPDVFKIDW
jgi:hypothetical protein